MLRDTQIRSIHEMEELKRAQELRVDEFSVQKLRHGQAYCTRAHITDTGIAGWNERHERFLRIPRRRIDLQWKNDPTIPVNRQLVVPSPRGLLSRDQSLRPDTWNLLGTSGNVFDSSRAPIDSSSTPYRGRLHSCNLNGTDGDPVRPSTARPVAGSEERNRVSEAFMKWEN